LGACPFRGIDYWERSLESPLNYPRFLEIVRAVSSEIRSGDSEKALQTIQWMRGARPLPGDPRADIWVIFLEGIVGFYTELRKSSLDRLIRSASLAKALGYSDIHSSILPWVAHVAFNAERFELVGESLKGALENTKYLSSLELARVALVLADSYQLLGRVGDSNEWYRLAHRASVAAADRPSIGAVIFNRLSIGLSRARVDFALGRIDETPESRKWVVEALSSNSFHELVSISSLRDLADLSTARSLCIVERYEQATLIFEELLKSELSSIGGVSRDYLIIEFSVALMRAGELDRARRVIAEINRVNLAAMDSDDQCVLAHFAADLVEHLGVLIPGIPNPMDLELLASRWDQKLLLLDETIQALDPHLRAACASAFSRSNPLSLGDDVQ